MREADILSYAFSKRIKIHEDAVVDCKKRDIDTPDVREALNLLDPVSLA